MRLLLLLLALVLATPTLTGCSAYQAYVQRQALSQARFSLQSAGLTGLDLTGAGFELVIGLENPTETAIVLDRLDYTLFVNETPLIAGYTAETLTVPPGQTGSLRLVTRARYADVGAQLRQVLQVGVKSYRLQGVGHFDTPFGTIDVPIDLIKS